MKKTTFFICKALILLTSMSFLSASQPETEFTVPAAPDAPDAQTVTRKTPAAVTRQPSLQETLAARLQQRRAATGDEEEIENESGNKNADVVKFQLLEAKTIKLKNKVRTLKEQLKTAEAHEALDELNSEAKELETAELRENIKILELKLTRAEREETRYKEKLAESIAERLEEREKARLTLLEGTISAARTALDLDAENFAAKEKKFCAKEKRVELEIKQANTLIDLAKAHFTGLLEEFSALEKLLGELDELDDPLDDECERCLEKSILLDLQIRLAVENEKKLAERYSKAVQNKLRLVDVRKQLNEELLKIEALEKQQLGRLKEYTSLLIEYKRLLENNLLKRQG